ncbi:hypothetical protein MNBD_BACTEROID01-1502 [hydrothermal vent metagenome]|uniref:MORN repeat variant n=1 Tax=hydrothermal vent metagenome TaxID=652676 RepID=A0A3B0TLV0_9ZZZZ
MKAQIILLIFLPFIILPSCFNQSAKKVSDEKAVGDSILVIQKVFANSPDKIEYEIPVLKGTKLRHGVQKRYYLHGSLYSKISYKRNKRAGMAYTYYKAYNGKKPVVWKEQSYKNGLLDGVCRRYHKDGKLQAVYEYSKGLPAIGLKEYSQSGKELKQPTLILKKNETGGNILITARMSNNTKRVVYYRGNLAGGKYVTKNLKKLPVNNGVGEIMVPFTTNEKSITIIAETTTRYLNKYYTAATIQLK